MATLTASHLRSPLPVSDLVLRFEADALADAAKRSGFAATAMRADDPASLAKWAMSAGAMQIATPDITRGPLRDWLDETALALAKAGTTLCEWRRDWDAAIAYIRLVETGTVLQQLTIWVTGVTAADTRQAFRARSQTNFA